MAYPPSPTLFSVRFGLCVSSKYFVGSPFANENCSLILILGVCENLAWPRTIALQLDSLTEAYSYGSSPEAGMPSLPFKDSSIRKSTEQPFFDFTYHDEDEQQVQIVARDEPTTEWKLVGVQ